MRLTQTLFSNVFFLLVILQVTHQQETCSIGCLKCASSSSCSICDSSNNYVLNSSNTCEIQIIPNCRLSTTKDECLQCLPHFYLSNKKCEQVDATKIIKGCIVYSSSTSCSICSDEYYLKSDKCEMITSSLKVSGCLQYSEEGCEICNEGTPNSSKTECITSSDIDFNCSFFYEGQFCEQCNENFSLSYPVLDSSSDSNYQKILIHESLYGKDRIGSLAQPKCAPTPQGSSTTLLSACSHSLTISKACADCDFSTHYFNFMNLTCEIFPKIQQTENIYGIDHCISLNLQYECTLCFEGYFLHFSKKKCFAHSSAIENCQIMSQSIDSQCVLCADEFYLQNNQCKQRNVIVENCLQLDYFADKCSVCNDNFSIQNNGTSCLQIPDNCQDFQLVSTSISCSVCKSPFHLFDGVCEEIPEEHQVSGCVSFSKTVNGDSSVSYQCLKCDPLFSLVQNKFKLSGNHTAVQGQTAPSEVDNPDDYICLLKSAYFADLAGCDKFVENECLECSDGGVMYSQVNDCTAISHSSPGYIEHCRVYNSDGSCLQCYKSYLNEDTGKCVITNSQDCEVYENSPTLTDSPTCVLCSPGNQLYNGECYDLSESTPDFDNCLAYDNNNNCIFCGPGYINYYNSSQTGTPTKSHKCFDHRTFLSHSLANLILACTSFEIISDSDIKCFGCIKGYELDSNSHCQPCLPQFLKSNLVDSFVYDSSLQNIYCKNDFGANNGNCLYYSSDSYNKCLVYSKGFVGSLLMDELDNSSNYVQVPLIKMSFFGTLMSKNWRETRPEQLSQLPYLHSRKKTAPSANSKLLHYLFADSSNYDSSLVFGGVCHLGYTRDFTGISLFTDDCNHTIKNCDTRSLVFYDGKVGHMTSCSRCFGDRVLYYTQEQMNKSLISDISTELSKGYSSSFLPSTFCYPNSLTGNISNCGVYEITSTNSGTEYSIECKACKPKFKPTMTGPVITACEPISFCKSSRLGNMCELCQKGYGFTSNADFHLSRQTCAILSVSVQNCLEWNGDLSSPLCSLCRPGYNDISKNCKEHFLGDCSHFDNQGNCLKCEGFGKIAYITNVITEIDKGCRPGTYRQLSLCKTQYSENVCFECFSSSMINSQGRCFSKNSVSNCEFFDPISEKCIKCKSNYNLDFDSQICVPIYSYLKAESEIDYLQTLNDSDYEPSFTCPVDISYNLMTFGYPYQINNNSLRACGTIGLHNCSKLDLNKFKTEQKIECLQCENTFLIQNLVSPLTKCLFIEPIRNCASQKFDENLNMMCYECKSGFYLTVEGTCLKRSFSPKCLEFYINYDKCKKCEEDYYLDVSLNTCKLRFNKNSICVQYYTTKDECQIFSEVYQYLDSRMITLLKFPPSKPLQSSDTATPETNSDSGVGIAGCVIYESKDICNKCDSTSYLYDNHCLGVSISVENCQAYSDSETCSECIHGYLLQNNKCSSVLSVNCLVYEDEYKCRLCSFEFPFLDSNFKCKKNPDNPNCKIYYNTHKCDVCEDGYHLTNEGLCVTISSVISGCALYSNEDCLKCDFGYKLSASSTDSSKSVCQKVIGTDTNCKSSTFSKKQCGMCKPGYILKDNICERCDQVVSGCAICNKSNFSECLICKSGYSMDSSSNCIVNSDVRSQFVKITYEL